jgi:hypothetical protein
MTRNAPVLVFRQPVMTPVLLLGTAALATVPTPTSRPIAPAVTAASFRLFRWVFTRFSSRMYANVVGGRKTV